MLYLLIATLLLITLPTKTHAQSTLHFDTSNALVVSNAEPHFSYSRQTSQKRPKHTRTRQSSPDRSETIPARKGRGRIIVRWKEHRMPDSVAEKLMEVERKFGPIQIISSCRPGAVVKNTNVPSMHSFCRAVDFYPPKNKYNEVSSFLKRTWSGGVGTYSGRFNHIHIDDNRGRWHN